MRAGMAGRPAIKSTAPVRVVDSTPIRVAAHTCTRAVLMSQTATHAAQPVRHTANSACGQVGAGHLAC